MPKDRHCYLSVGIQGHLGFPTLTSDQAATTSHWFEENGVGAGVGAPSARALGLHGCLHCVRPRDLVPLRRVQEGCDLPP